MKILAHPRTLAGLVALLLTILIILIIRTLNFSMSEDSALKSGSTADVIANSKPASSMATAAATDDASDPTIVSVRLIELLAICSGNAGVVELVSCQDEFARSGNSLSAGENVIFIPSETITGSEVEFSLNDQPELFLLSDIDAAISDLEIGVVHSVKIRRRGQGWSNSISFTISLQKPKAPRINFVCVDMICSPPNELVAPLRSSPTSFYPLVEFISGLTDPPSRHIWAEIVLDDDESYVGCLNCEAAKAAGIVYEDREEFGLTGIFYNWDLSDLEEGHHSIKARLRNKLYTGAWSQDFQFYVSRP